MAQFVKDNITDTEAFESLCDGHCRFSASWFKSCIFYFLSLYTLMADLATSRSNSSSSSSGGGGSSSSSSISSSSSSSSSNSSSSSSGCTSSSSSSFTL